MIMLSYVLYIKSLLFQHTYDYLFCFPIQNWKGTEKKINYYFSFVFVKFVMLSGRKYEIKIKYVTIKCDRKSKIIDGSR